MGREAVVVCLVVLLAPSVAAPADPQVQEAYLGWSAVQCESVGRSTYVKGRVGGLWDTRMLKTERAVNYKLAATWLTPDVIRATARQIQLRSRLSDEETRQLVAEAEAAAQTVILVELDPREGSGVIPSDWQAFLQPKGQRPGALGEARGLNSPALYRVRALNGVLRRNYDYDRFWVAFPLIDTDGRRIFPDSVPEAELVVRVHDQEGRVTWQIPESIRQRTLSLLSVRPNR